MILFAFSCNSDKTSFVLFIFVLDRIEDNQGRKYDRFSGDSLYIADSLNLGEQLQPGLSVSGAIVFEMPKDSENLALIITGDWLSSSEVKVSLTEIKSIGADTTLVRQQNEMWN